MRRAGAVLDGNIPYLDLSVRLVGDLGEGARWEFWPQSILLVDDDQAIRQLASRVLREKGHTVLVASSGREAIAILK